MIAQDLNPNGKVDAIAAIPEALAQNMSLGSFEVFDGDEGKPINRKVCLGIVLDIVYVLDAVHSESR